MSEPATVQTFQLGDFALDCGKTLPAAQIAYATYGTLAEGRDNVVVFPTWFVGSHLDLEWFVGAGKALDTGKYFVIVPHMFGNGRSSSPSNTPAPFDRGRFPAISVQDNVRAQHRLMTEVFDVRKIQLVIGGSMGAFQAYQWGLAHPDLVERNTHWVRGLDVPDAVKAVGIGLLAVTWRPFYYAPNTVHTWLARGQSLAFTEEGSQTPPRYKRTLYLRCYAPYALLQFVGLPALFLPLGPLAAASALVNSLGAEALTNLHTFLVVGPNHTGDDIYRFDTPARSKAEAAVRQVLGSVNYATGTELGDYAHLWLNYQIEHHLFPDMPMLRYRQIQPRIKALCAKHGIPYVQESVWSRVRKLVSVAIGRSSMKRATRVGKPREREARATAAAE